MKGNKLKLRVKSLKINNFRNYGYLDLEFDDNINIIYGDNAQGKTNILEAIYFTATTKSHKGAKEKELLKFNNEEAHINMIVDRNKSNFEIDVHLKKNAKKGIAINKIPIKKSAEIFGIVNIVFFSPEDLSIIKNGPSERRRFIDIELSQLNKIYLNDIINYNKVLNQRNKLLKEITYQPQLLDTLDIWDEQLVKFGNRIIEQREEFIQEMNGIIKVIHKNLSGGKENVELIYEKSTKNESFSDTLKKTRNKDIKMRSTSTGPHRDDIAFMVNGLDIRTYGSQGQQRTAALSLKMSEIELVKKVIKDQPILLLDDVLSELDSSRQNFLLDSIKDVQTIITCTGVEEFIKHRFNIDKIFYVKDGTVKEEN